ncbi:MAG TPA: hypothetical protein DEQ20_08940 [Desulfobulbaceae bacterium]|nr:MAG: hypothetical protein A2520_10665 [Deltaproteobacteria bacterium RIFOXYD12_FULL_53_23]HCC55027.1 hypothetical protein [Desulfobulbaceae bacterium]
MDTKTGAIMKYLLRTLRVGCLLLVAWGGFGAAPSFAGDLKTTTFQVEGVSCGSCLSTIRGELFKKPGMVAFNADLAQGLLRIDHRPPLSEEAIVRTLADLGYPAKSVQAQVAPQAGKPAAKGCSGCGPNGCSATASSWRDLGRKIFGNGKL